MHTGMLWFDSTPGRSLNLKIQSAIDYYRRKFHRDPNLCLINPGMLSGENVEVGRLTVRTYGFVLPHHLWIGVEDEG